ncbi:MAG: hypothetical protein GF384_03175, partial [Elusimicrobia bacterium]|nr:hypothetical protein [Elusimicrobiota bacterium]
MIKTINKALSLVLTVLLAAEFAVPFGYADTINLKNGGMITGTITGKDTDSILIKDDNSQMVLEIKKSAIESIEQSTPKQEKFKPLAEPEPVPEHKKVPVEQKEEIPAGTKVFMYEHSPYHMTKDLVVEKDQTVVIEPGVEIRIDNDVSFIIRGRLEAQGTLYKRIKLIPFDNKPWGGIVIQNGQGTSIIEYCSIEQAQGSNVHGFVNGGAVQAVNSSLTVAHSLIESCSADRGGAVYAKGSEINFYENKFRNNTASIYGGGLYIENCTGTISKNVFYKNTAGFEGGAFYASGFENITTSNK